MSKLSEKLLDLSGSVLSSIYAPDSYSDLLVEIWGTMEMAYQQNKETVFENFEEVKSLIKRDADTVLLIEERLMEGFNAFDRGDKELGRKIMLGIYAMQLGNLR
ncbi:hypothetical protein [Stenotrophomonas sp. PS02289]|uniref:hypothetical protein n=1 Tax=Stenotrophomonas sp. PS02289 TaxID=2991422 RepID=UPI00249A18A2|nr:hypothetical protein [Stenotrophomonas sp. PS02289]